MSITSADIQLDDPGSTNLHPLSSATFFLAKAWIDKCKDEHPTCNIRYDTTFKPTRLIDVGERNVSPRLIETTTTRSTDLQYIALSHRWGSSMPDSAMTKLATIRKRLTRIPVRTLPNSFRDAVIATRRLGLRYLWIDSLCILQDSPEDWQRESALMGKVYSHSFCMIAAAAASDSFGGLFAQDTDLPLLPASRDMPESCAALRSAWIKPRVESWDELFNASKLNERGWTLQERELSPRILYFTKHTLLFECRKARSTGPLLQELRGPDSDRETFLAPKEYVAMNSKNRRCLDQPAPEDMTWQSRRSLIRENRYLDWMNMIEGYSERTLSTPTDKFPGLSGLASEFAYILDDQYVAGLWRRDLARGLCWRWKENTVTHRLSERSSKIMMMNYGPSWSWAKMIVPISYDLVAKGSGGAQLIEPNANLEAFEPHFLHVTTVAEGKDPNGTLVSATIHLEGFIFRASRSKTGNLLVLGQSLRVTWDFLPQTATTYFILSLGETGAGLVLIHTELNDNEYRRVGIIPTIQREWFNQSDIQKLTLV
ncbi:hypothetical protein D0Z07_7017 [Hyphodiscus hymeniophilus]|uniref:Heterokaryon incompatibility domain-containing protein n=1 Tax=Hyphodiscus hymeniophilus TaxID=353542 RepID=A0A9P6VG88_9HELO|nr:hypothetical protein D0Z07_7017 [Hyphodiscus hymeniophilus]